MMTVEEAADYLQVNPKTLYRWLREGEVPGIKLGGNVWRVKKATLDEWVSRRSLQNVFEQAPRLTQEWLDRVRARRERLLEGMGGVPFRGDELDEMIDEGHE